MDEATREQTYRRLRDLASTSKISFIIPNQTPEGISSGQLVEMGDWLGTAKDVFSLLSPPLGGTPVGSMVIPLVIKKRHGLGSMYIDPASRMLISSSIEKRTVPCDGPDCPLCRAGNPQRTHITRFKVVGIEQFRKPRSKKKRIQKKWRKDPRNWRPKEGGNSTLEFKSESTLGKFLKSVCRGTAAPSSAQPGNCPQ